MGVDDISQSGGGGTVLVPVDWATSIAFFACEVFPSLLHLTENLFFKRERKEVGSRGERRITEESVER